MREYLLRRGGDSEKRRRSSTRSPFQNRDSHDEDGPVLPWNFFSPGQTGERAILPASPETGFISRFRVASPHDGTEREAEDFARGYSTGDATNQPASLKAPGGGASLHASGSESGFSLDREQEKRVTSAIGNRGTPLPESQKRELEQSLGLDLSRVRLHTGEAAERAAHAIHAKAFTMGNDIVFGKDEFKPGTKEGDHLLAHEVAHVAQHGSAPSTIHRQEAPSPARNRGASLGHFLITVYNIANEADHPAENMIQAHGLNHRYSEAFLRDIIMQGSGADREGRLIQIDWSHGRPRGPQETFFRYVTAIHTANGTALEDGVSIAVDPSVIPLGSWVYIDGAGWRRADDTGGRIHGNHIDLFRLVPRAEALQGTRTNIEVWREAH